MSDKQETKRGKYMLEWTPEKRSEVMRSRALKKWSGIDTQERSRLALTLVEARRIKRLKRYG